jgi:hypothetical protein
MDTELFQSLLASLKEAVAISNGTAKPGRVFVRNGEEFIEQTTAPPTQASDAASEVEQK